MKRTNSRRIAFINLRVAIASLLLVAAGIVTLLAGRVEQGHDERQASGSPAWLTRLASAVGINAPLQTASAHDSARPAGGAIMTEKYPAEPPPATPSPTVVPYAGAPQLLTPVVPVRTAKLRDMRPIDAAKVLNSWHPEPIQPKAPTQNTGTTVKASVQTTQGAQSSAPVATGVNFEGIGVGLAGFTPSGNPPDVNGRVGATQFVQWNNTSFAVFNKTTGALEYGPTAGNTLFQSLGGVCASHNDGDPVVSYDVLAGRWVLSQFAVAGGDTTYSHECIAVSATEDATGEYYVYDFETDKTNFVDYPHTGVWPDGYYMSAHVFSVEPTDMSPIGLPVAPPNAFIQGRVYVFERQKMINGQPARMQSQDIGAEYGFLPADLDSLTPPPTGEAEFLISPNFVQNNITDTYRVAVTWDPAPTIVVTPGTPITDGLDSAPCVGDPNNTRACVPEPSPATNADYLDNIAFHYMYRFAYRNQGTQAAPDESLVASGPTIGSDSNHGAVRWFEFRNNGSSTATPSLFQAGTYDPDTDYRWVPSIAMDIDRNIAMGYSRSSTTSVPSIYVTGRLATDTAGMMGAETLMQAGIGVQQGGGNRWGDYTAMTLDPIDQCTFYYTNEYLKTNGAFNWSTRIASYKFPTCHSAAAAYGTVTGTITSAETGTPISGVRVALNNGYAGASDDNGVYTIIVPAGSYTATAADANRNCTSASPASATVAPQGGGTVTQNFTMAGTSKLEAGGFTIDDSLGNANGVVNRSECVLLNLGVKNNGCAKATGITAHLTTTTAGVTVTDADSTYSDEPIDATAPNATPFKISVSDSFSCGTPIALSLNLTYAGGTKTISYSVPSCAGGPDQTIPTSQLTTSDSTQNDRIGRDGFPSTCSGKKSPGGGFTGTHYYKTFNFTNTSGADRCYTVTINAGLGGPGDIESVAYDQTYDPTSISTNYLGDSGITGLGTTVDHASYSFTVPAGHVFVVVVNTTGSNTSGTTASSQFSGTVSGFIDNTAGPGACTTSNPSPTATPTATATVTPTPTATPTATPTPSPLPAKLLNISTRSRIQSGDNVMIGGFIVTGRLAKNVLVRALGPSLNVGGAPVAGRMDDPVLELHDKNGALINFNDNWKDTQQADITATGLQPSDDRESAIVRQVAPGSYTAVMRGKNNSTGIGLVEAYDLDKDSPVQLANISTRGFVETGDNVMIGGFIAGPSTGRTNSNVVIRAIGPSLAAAGVPNTLQDPTLEIHDQNGAIAASNDDWATDPNAAKVVAAGLAPSDPRESAIYLNVAPAEFTAIVRGKDPATGNALVEIYNLQ